MNVSLKSPFSTTVLMLCLVTLFNGLIGFGELTEAPFRNDGALHLHQIERLDTAFRLGQSVLDHWDPTLVMGYPFARTYSLLSHLLVWGSFRLSGEQLSLVFWYGSWTWLLWMCLPLSIFSGARLLGLRSDQALGAALACVLMHTSFRFGIAPETYFWLGYGLLPNLLGLVLLPPAVGIGVRFLRQGRDLFPALCFLAATWFSHLVMGYVASFSLAVCALVLLREKGFRTVAFRLMLLGLACLTVCAFFLYPYVLEGFFINHTVWEPAHYWDSYGISEILVALVSGNLLDHKMWFPILSLLVPVGLWRVFSGQKELRLLVVLCGFWFVAFLGRSWWNPASWILLFNDHVPFERFLVPTQWLLGMVIGIGWAYLLTCAKKLPIPNWAAVVLCLLPVVPHMVRNVYQHPVKANEFKATISNDFEALSTRMSKTMPLLKAQQDGARVLVPHDRELKFRSVSYNQIPLDANLPHVGALWHSMSLNSEYLGMLDPTRTSHLNLFAIKFALAPEYYWPGAALQPLNKDAGLTLYTNPRYDGLFTMGRLSEKLDHRPDPFREQVTAWLTSRELDDGRFLYVPDGAKASPTEAKGPDPRKGFYTSGLRIEEKGRTRISLRAQTKHAGWLIGKFTFHPGWQVTVDGQIQDTLMVSPSFPAVHLEPGVHEIVFTYVPHPWTARFFYLAILVLLIVGIGPFLRRFIPQHGLEKKQKI